MTRLQVPHQRVPRRTKAKPASERPPSRGVSDVHRFDDGPQTQTTGPGDGRARRRRRRRGNVGHHGDVRGRGGAASRRDGDGERAVAAVIVDRDDIGGAAVGAAVVGVERVGVGGVSRRCSVPSGLSESLSLVIGRRRPLPSPVPGAIVGRRDPRHHYATLSHGEKVEVESVAGPRGRSGERAEGRDATRGREPAGAAGATSSAASDRGCYGEAVAQPA